MGEQLKVLSRAEFVVERHKNATAIEDRIGRDQPFRLIGHDDRGAIVRIEVSVFEGAGERQCDLFEIGIGETKLFAITLRLNQTDFGGKAIKGIAQGGAETGVLTEIEHQRFISPQRRGDTEKSLVINSLPAEAETRLRDRRTTSLTEALGIGLQACLNLAGKRAEIGDAL